MNRRTLLLSLLTAGAVSLVGCSSAVRKAESDLPIDIFMTQNAERIVKNHMLRNIVFSQYGDPVRKIKHRKRTDVIGYAWEWIGTRPYFDEDLGELDDVLPTVKRELVIFFNRSNLEAVEYRLTGLTYIQVESVALPMYIQYRRVLQDEELATNRIPLCPGESLEMYRKYYRL